MRTPESFRDTLAVLGGEWLARRAYRRETGEILEVGPVSVREMNLRSFSEMQAYISFLHDPRNISHFANPPKDVRTLRQAAVRPGHHFLVGTRYERYANGRMKDIVIGGAEIADAGRNFHDHFLSLFVIDPEKQGAGIGADMLTGAVDYAATTLTADGRVRDKLDLGIIMSVPGWRRMERLVKRFGFKLVSNLPRQVDAPIEDENGKWTMQRKPSRRYELFLGRWRTTRELPSPLRQPLVR